MILVKDEAISAVITTLNKEYYKPNKLSDGITICVPVNGSGLIEG